MNDNNLGGSALTALAPLTKLRRLDVAGAYWEGAHVPDGVVALSGPGLWQGWVWLLLEWLQRCKQLQGRQAKEV